MDYDEKRIAAVQKLFVRAIAGDDDACMDLFNQWLNLARNFVAVRLADPNDVDDIVVTSFYKLLEWGKEHYEPQANRHPFTLFRQRLTWSVVDFVRKKERTPKSGLPQELLDSSSATDGGFGIEELEELVACCPNWAKIGEQQKKVFLLVLTTYPPPYAFKEIAQLLEMSEANLRSIYYRTRKVLQDGGIGDLI